MRIDLGASTHSGPLTPLLHGTLWQEHFWSHLLGLRSEANQPGKGSGGLLRPCPLELGQGRSGGQHGGQHWVGLNRLPEERLTQRLKQHVLASWGQLALAEEIEQLSRREEVQPYFH